MPQANESTQPIIRDEFGRCDAYGFAEFVELSRNGISRRYKTWGEPHYTGKTGPDMVIKD